MAASSLATTARSIISRSCETELEAKGYRFRSRTDTEVVLAAYAEWGEAALGRFNGMFAFAIWDRSARELFLARDRYGIKPLYYADGHGRFTFGSEVKAILAHPGQTAELDLKGLVEYITFQNFFTDRTLFKGVRLLPAGCWLRVRQGDAATVKTERYWDFHFVEPEHHAGEARVRRGAGPSVPPGGQTPTGRRRRCRRLSRAAAWIRAR